jgi:hypothetical protein
MMMRQLFILAIAALLAGCTTGGSAPRPMPHPGYVDASASALAFTPPVSLDQPPVQLPRELRQASAFVGFEQLTTTIFHIRTDDRFGDNGFNWLIRRAVSEQTGVSYR